MSRDLLLDASHDLVIKDFDLQLTNESTITRQKIKQTLSLFQGEWFLNENAGMPYYQEILGYKGSTDRVQTLFIRAIKAIPEVSSIKSFNIDFNKSTGVVSVGFEVMDIYNNTIEVTL